MFSHIFVCRLVRLIIIIIHKLQNGGRVFSRANQILQACSSYRHKEGLRLNSLCQEMLKKKKRKENECFANTQQPTTCEGKLLLIIR